MRTASDALSEIILGIAKELKLAHGLLDKHLYSSSDSVKVIGIQLMDRRDNGFMARIALPRAKIAE